MHITIGIATRGRAAILAQLVGRWAAYSRDGDMIGGDLPGWLGTLFRKRGIAALTDQRGECEQERPDRTSRVIGKGERSNEPRDQEPKTLHETERTGDVPERMLHDLPDGEDKTRKPHRCQGSHARVRGHAELSKGSAHRTFTTTLPIASRFMRQRIAAA